MKILELKIRNYGKMKDWNAEFSPGINLIYGRNESGKSTVHTFIKSMLFGLARGRGRAAANDIYSRYEPWENPDFYSGMLRFESGGKHFVLDRNFGRGSKKAELFCEDDGERLFEDDGDLQMLLGEMFSESVYENTVSVGQLKAQPGQELAAGLRNYATNFYASGGGDLNLDGALRKLKERERDIDRQIKADFQKKQEKRERIEQEASYIWREMHGLQTERDTLLERIDYRRKHQPKMGEPENNRVIDELRPGKWRVHPVEILSFIAAVALVVIFIHRPWNYLVAIVLALLCAIYTWNRLKVSKKQEKTEPERILEEIAPEEEKVPLERLCWEAERIAGELEEKQVQYNNLREQLGEMDEMGEEFWELERQREAVSLASDKINELSAQLQKQLTAKMNTVLSEIISQITGGKYTRLMMDKKLELCVLCKDRRAPLESLSRGTIEQLYLTLRMASAGIFQEEEMPIVLDDTFVYYDDERLAHTLRWMSENKGQVLIFTCQKREEEVLDKLKIPYRKIKL